MQNIIGTKPKILYLKVRKMEKEIKEIKCDVSNCAYNKDQRKCMAGQIEVGTCGACTTDETICRTFKKCSDRDGCE